MCGREAANVAARAANPNQQMVLCSAGFVMRHGSRASPRSPCHARFHGNVNENSAPPLA
ncbi:hypothetical protein BSLA_01f3530 [Burkholderia stabilis]|nr:hypothetical protein BSLA_01f3530 [Burkholderia stabilis]